jgi:AcrR family transcriptional regulator
MARKTPSVEVRSEQLAQAVVDILAEQGRGALTREKISERAGLSRPLIYYYFNSAEAVLGSSFRWICQRIMERETQLARKAEVVGLETLISCFVPDAESSRRLYRAFFALLPEAAIKDDLRVEAEKVRERRRELVAELLLEATRTGDVRPPDGCDLDAITGMLESAAMRAAVEVTSGRGILANALDALRRYLRPYRAVAA